MTASNPRTKALRLDPRLRVLFKEMAWDIIAKDRYARRKGLSQNTIGEIERALVKVYTLARTSQVDSAPLPESRSKAIVDWISIPPRSRETLVSMTFRFSKRWG